MDAEKSAFYHQILYCGLFKYIDKKSYVLYLPSFLFSFVIDRFFCLSERSELVSNKVFCDANTNPSASVMNFH